MSVVIDWHDNIHHYRCQYHLYLIGLHRKSSSENKYCTVFGVSNSYCYLVMRNESSWGQKWIFLAITLPVTTWSGHGFEEWKQPSYKIQRVLWWQVWWFIYRDVILYSAQWWEVHILYMYFGVVYQFYTFYFYYTTFQREILYFSLTFTLKNIWQPYKEQRTVKNQWFPTFLACDLLYKSNIWLGLLVTFQMSMSFTRERCLL